MKNLLYILITAAIFAFFGCENFFATTVRVDPPPSTPKLAVTAFWNVDNQGISFFVDGSTDIFGDQEVWTGGDLGIGGAKVEVIADGVTKLEIQDPNPPNGTSGVRYLTTSENWSDWGSEFELVVSHPNYPTTRAKQRIPTKVVPTDYKYLANAGVDDYGESVEGIEVSFKDPEGEKNFYEVAIFYKDSSRTIDDQLEYYFEQTYNASIDPNANQGPNYNDLFVSDQAFDGENYKLLVQFYRYENESDTLTIVFNSITEDRYRFATSLRAFNDAGDFGPFAEPVSIYSNFENGLGTFGLGNPHVELITP